MPNDKDTRPVNRTQIVTENLTPEDGVDGVTLETAPAGLSADSGVEMGGGEIDPREPQPKPRTVTGDGIREVDVRAQRTTAAKADTAPPATKNAGAAPSNKGA